MQGKAWRKRGELRDKMAMLREKKAMKTERENPAEGGHDRNEKIFEDWEGTGSVGNAEDEGSIQPGRHTTHGATETAPKAITAISRISQHEAPTTDLQALQTAPSTPRILQASPYDPQPTTPDHNLIADLESEISKSAKRYKLLQRTLWEETALAKDRLRQVRQLDAQVESLSRDMNGLKRSGVGDEAGKQGHLGRERSTVTTLTGEQVGRKKDAEIEAGPSQESIAVHRQDDAKQVVVEQDCEAKELKIVTAVASERFNRIEELETEVEALKERNAAVREQANIVVRRNHELQTEAEALNERNASLQDQANTQEAIVDSLERRVAELEDLRERNLKLEIRAVEDQATMTSLGHQVTNLIAELESSKARAFALEERLAGYGSLSNSKTTYSFSAERETLRRLLDEAVIRNRTHENVVNSLKSTNVHHAASPKSQFEDPCSHSVLEEFPFHTSNPST